MMIDLKKVLDKARKEFGNKPGVVSVDERENLLRITVDSEDTRKKLPQTFYDEEQNYEIGTEYTILG